MQGIAADVGYSETVFLAGDGGPEWTARYFSPEAEVPVLRARDDRRRDRPHLAGRRRPNSSFDTAPGQVPVAVEDRRGGPWATLTSVEPHVVRSRA